jgi:hypothetical protein
MPMAEQHLTSTALDIYRRQLEAALESYFPDGRRDRGSRARADRARTPRIEGA